MSYRALALDLDGTLLGPDDKVSPRNRAAVRAAVDAGWHVILSTARWYEQAERTAVELDLMDPVIACSGAEVRRRRDGAELFDERLAADFSAELYELCDREGAFAMVCQDREVLLRLHREPNTPQNPEIRWTDRLAGVAMDRPRCALLFGDEFNALVLDTLAPRWRDHVRFLVSKNRAGASVLTLTSGLADKGTALRVACADLGIGLGDVVAMGDSETDIEMFKVAGAGVAMGQAADDVQRAATWVTATHADDGVGVAIEELLAGRRDAH